MDRSIYERIIANVVLLFFTTLATLNLLDLGEKALIVAVVNAGLIAIIAGLKEYQLTLNYKKGKPPFLTKTATKLLVF